MKIYTKTGDKGETSLFGGERVSKDSLRIEAYGSTDELNAVIGMALAEITDSDIRDVIFNVQNDLFVLGSDLATPADKGNKNFVIPRIDERLIIQLEKGIDFFEAKLPPLKSFILPGGTKGSALLHFARTVCRRAERKVVTLSKNVDIGDKIIIYLNRLSDLLFVLARYDNFVSNLPDTEWKK